ncbi:alpha/beta hydrolase family esterase [Pseudonocardia xinjiangensis]|uniref:alpha/beta hydrolase family esterase n=1 Tax=Pseudonocardia xinjiangensis TaxID=75289 RepID=UPI003D8BC3A3
MASRTARVVATLGAALAGLALVGSALAPPATASPPPRPAQTEAAGCRSSPDQQPGTSVLHTIHSGGRDRTYQLHLPKDYSAKRSWPLVLAFHGRGNTGAGTEEFSGLSTLPAVVAYPNGVIGTGDGDRQAWEGAPYAAAGVDDVAFTGDLLNSLEKTLCIDQQRVYATGKSNGAGFTGLLACRMAGRFAAIAPVAGAFYGQNGTDCHPSRPVPVIEFHGTADATIPYGGDAARGLPAITDWAAGWAARDGCRAEPATSSLGADVTQSTWTGCKSGAEVRQVAIAGGGHTWPGAESYSGGGVTTHTIKAQDVLWQFVSRFRLPAR